MSTHTTYHAFCEHFKEWYFSRRDNGKRVFDSTKMVGSEAIGRVKDYSITHPQIKIVSVDDYVFSGSIIILIPHVDMGITAIFVPQCTTVNNQFFLYPLMAEKLIDGINEVSFRISE